jgi:hypothetical protein
MEGPPLWIWALIVGIIISSKFVYRWVATKGLANEAKRGKNPFKNISRNWKTRNPTGIINHKYNPQKYSPGRFKDYFTTRKKQ